MTSQEVWSYFPPSGGIMSSQQDWHTEQFTYGSTRPEFVHVSIEELREKLKGFAMVRWNVNTQEPGLSGPGCNFNGWVGAGRVHVIGWRVIIGRACPILVAAGVLLSVRDFHAYAECIYMHMIYGAPYSCAADETDLYLTPTYFTPDTPVSVVCRILVPPNEALRKPTSKKLWWVMTPDGAETKEPYPTWKWCDIGESPSSKRQRNNLTASPANNLDASNFQQQFRSRLAELQQQDNLDVERQLQQVIPQETFEQLVQSLSLSPQEVERQKKLRQELQGREQKPEQQRQEQKLEQHRQQGTCALL